MHANLSALLHVHVTSEWLLQLQRIFFFFFFLVDSAEGPNGPEAIAKAGGQARTGATQQQAQRPQPEH